LTQSTVESNANLRAPPFPNYVCNVLSNLIDFGIYSIIPPEFFLTTFSLLIPEIFFVTG
jgi:hypothetical protein